MFRRFREKLERALERREAARPLSRDEIDELLRGMREELIDLRARIPRLEREAERLAGRAEQFIRRAELAHAKAREAQGADRAGEASSALDAAKQALQEAESLRGQSAEARAEADRLRAEAAEKMEQLKEAERNRDVLVARSRRAGAARKLDDLLRGPESGVRRFERAEEDLEAAEDLAAAAREVDAALGERPAPAEAEADLELRRLEAADEAADVERRLAELKRQIQEEDD